MSNVSPHTEHYQDCTEVHCVSRRNHLQSREVLTRARALCLRPAEAHARPLVARRERRQSEAVMVTYLSGVHRCSLRLPIPASCHQPGRRELQANCVRSSPLCCSTLFRGLHRNLGRARGSRGPSKNGAEANARVEAIHIKRRPPSTTGDSLLLHGWLAGHIRQTLRANPSIEGTCNIWLRQLSPAPHVKR